MHEKENIFVRMLSWITWKLYKHKNYLWTELKHQQKINDMFCDELYKKSERIQELEYFAIEAMFFYRNSDRKSKAFEQAAKKAGYLNN